MHTRGNRRVSFPRQAQAGRRGFTIVELLVVMFVLAILVALVVGVSTYVMDTQAANQTRAAQAILLQAVHAYEDKHGEPPEDLWDLRQDPQTRRIIQELNEDFIDTDNQRFRDAFGTQMGYSRTGAFGGGPVIMSAGPDRSAQFLGGDQDDDADNIRSDDQKSIQS